MMVRGISDMPARAEKEFGRAWLRCIKLAAPAHGAGTQERDAWKEYASAISAHFVTTWIASEWWPRE